MNVYCIAVDVCVEGSMSPAHGRTRWVPRRRCLRLIGNTWGEPRYGDQLLTNIIVLTPRGYADLEVNDPLASVA